VNLVALVARHFPGIAVFRLAFVSQILKYIVLNLCVHLFEVAMNFMQSI